MSAEQLCLNSVVYFLSHGISALRNREFLRTQGRRQLELHQVTQRIMEIIAGFLTHKVKTKAKEHMFRAFNSFDNQLCKSNRIDSVFRGGTNRQLNDYA